MSGILCGLFFLSGAAGLLFESLWFRQAGLSFGNGFWASSLVLASFMAGLGLGNAGVARFGWRLRRPLLAYAGLEAVVAICGATLVWALPQISLGITPLLRPFLDVPWLLNGLRVTFAFLLLALPATAMGATLPVLVKALTSHTQNFGVALGRLYAWNTLGAVLGAVAGEIALIEWLGVRGTAFVAAVANLVSAAGAIALSRYSGESRARAVQPEPVRVRLSPSARLLLLAAALSGCALLALEVIWFRFLHHFVHGGPLTFALMLAVVLSGIALGGILAGRWLQRDVGAFRHGVSLFLLSGLAVVVGYAAFLYVVAPYASVYVSDPGDVLALAAALMLPNAVLSGLLFPWLGAALHGELGVETRSAGLLTLVNTVGAALGSLLAGFALLPLLGVEHSLFAIALLYALAAGVLVLALRGRSEFSARSRGLAALALALALLLFPFGLMREHYLSLRLDLSDPNREFAAFREGRTETSVLLGERFLGEPLLHQLVTDGYAMSSTAVDARRYMKLFAYWPLALHPDARRALLISYGVGSTAKSLVDSAQLESIDVVDISREILEMSDLIYPAAGEHPLRDPRVRVHVEDGRYFLLTQNAQYDLITGEPPPPKMAGIVNLYTREYFQLVYERLAYGGIATYWLPMHDLLENDAKAILAAFCAVFRDCSLWSGMGLDWMLVGTREAHWSRSETDFRRQWEDAGVLPELRALGLERPEDLGALFIADAATLAGITRDVPPLTDDFPKRLSDAPVPPLREPGLLALGLDGRAARKRFARSEFIAEAWPPALRAASLAAFESQQHWNDLFMGNFRGVPWQRFHFVLTQTPLTALPLRMLGSDADRVAIARRVVVEEPGQGLAWRELALEALAGRDYARALTLLSRAGQSGYEEPLLLQLRVYALCALGRYDEAREAFAVASKGLPPRFRNWLEATFDLGGESAPTR